MTRVCVCAYDRLYIRVSILLFCRWRRRQRRTVLKSYNQPSYSKVPPPRPAPPASFVKLEADDAKVVDMNSVTSKVAGEPCPTIIARRMFVPKQGYGLCLCRSWDARNGSIHILIIIQKFVGTKLGPQGSHVHF